MFAAPSFGSEIAMLMVFLGGFGLPLGVPPEKENPVMSYVAPEECVLYASWAGMAAADPGSPNQAEQLLAEPEVREFAAALEQAFGRSIASAAARSGDERAALHAKAAPLWARTLITRPAAMFLTRLEPRGPSVAIEGGLILQAGEAAAELDASLTQMLASEDRQPVEITIGTRKFHKLAADDALPCDVVWGAGNGYLMVGLGAGAIEGMSARIRAQAEPAWLTVLRQELPIERRSTVSYINVRRLVDSFAPLAGPQAEAMLNSLGVRQIGALESSTGLDETGTLSRTTLTLDGPPRGLLAALSPEGIQAGDLAHIPDDALLATCVSFDAAAFYRNWQDALREADPRSAARFEEEMRGLETELGASLPEILASLGNNWSLHAAAADGGVMASALTVEVRDRAKLLAVQDRAAALFGRPGGPPMAVVRTDFGGQTIFHVRPGGRGAFPFTPAWSLTGKQLVLGLNPQAVKAVLARKAGDKSLADLPPVAQRLAGGDVTVGLTYYDTRAFFESLYGSLQMLTPMMLGQMQREGLALDFDPAMLPAPRTIGKHLQPSVTVVRRTQRGLTTETRQTLPGLNIGTSAPLAAALLLPAVQAAREAGERTRGANNLKQQLLALHNYHDTFRTFPSAYSAKGDKPLLSWRVAILPFLEQKVLYDQFRHDEPWDSEHNKALIAKMPDVFKAPGSKAGEGKTVYLGVGGKRGALVAPVRKDGNYNAGIGLQNMTDGTSNTICIVEAADEAAVIWTKPEEWVPDEKMPLKGLIGQRIKGFQVALCDGAVKFISQDIDPTILQRLFTRDDGLPAELPRPRR